jgi:hypothetical protein
MRQVFVEHPGMIRTQGGLRARSCVSCPSARGAAQGVLTQAAVAEKLGRRRARGRAWCRAWLAGLINGARVFHGRLALRAVHAPRAVYAAMGLSLASSPAAWRSAHATPPPTSGATWSTAWVSGLSYAAFTAVVLDAIGPGSAATKYTLYATLSNFPIWWVGLLLGYVADVKGADGMLYTEAGLGIGGIALFLVATGVVKRSKLPLHAEG